MTDGAPGAGATAVPATASGGELSELRGRGDEGTDEVHAVRAEERQALGIGDRVELAGRVSVVGMTSKGEQWIMVELDGVPPHPVACWAGNATQHKRADNEGEST